MKKMFISFMAMVALLVTWSCGGANDTPTAVVEKAVQCMQDKDYEGYVNLIAIEEKEGESIEDQKKALASMIEGKAISTIEKQGGIASYEVLEETVAEDGNTAKVKVNITYGDGTKKEDTIKALKDKDGKWMLDPKK